MLSASSLVAALPFSSCHAALGTSMGHLSSGRLQYCVPKVLALWLLYDDIHSFGARGKGIRRQGDQYALTVVLFEGIHGSHHAGENYLPEYEETDSAGESWPRVPVFKSRALWSML